VCFCHWQDQIHDNVWIDIRVYNPDSGNMFDHTFTDCMEIGYWVEEDDVFGDDAMT
jgi:hypothetical protein